MATKDTVTAEETTTEETTTEAKKTSKAKKGYREIFLFKDNDRYKDPALNVIINGKKYSVPRGKKVMVPDEVANVIERSQAQDAYAQAVDAEMQKEQVQNM